MRGMLERVSLWLAAAGTAMVWIIPYLLGGAGVPEWTVTRWYLLVAGPAIGFGLLAYPRFGGFAKSWIVVLFAALAVAGCLWTDPTEQGRGLLIAVGFIVVMPISALLRKREELGEFSSIFAWATAITMLYGLITTGGLVLRDSMGSNTTNPNGVGIQAALSLLLLWIFLEERRGWGRTVNIGCAFFLGFCAISTASRTAFLSLSCAVLVSLAFRSRKSAIAVLAGLLASTTAAIGVSELLEVETPFYQGIMSRLVQDDEGTRGTLGDRVQIWDVASVAFWMDTNWLHGTGTGGVDKTIGGLYESKGRAKGRDGIWRLHAHNTLVWSALAFGFPGILLLVGIGLRAAWLSRKLDLDLGTWEHSTLTAFILVASFGGVITQDGCWCAIGSVLFAAVSEPVSAARVEWVVREIAFGGQPQWT